MASVMPVREAAYSLLTDIDRQRGHRLAAEFLESAHERTWRSSLSTLCAVETRSAAIQLSADGGRTAWRVETSLARSTWLNRPKMCSR